MHLEVWGIGFLVSCFLIKMHKFGASPCMWDKKLPEPTHETGNASLNQNPSSFSFLSGEIYWHHNMTTAFMAI